MKLKSILLSLCMLLLLCACGGNTTEEPETTPESAVTEPESEPQPATEPVVTPADRSWRGELLAKEMKPEFAATYQMVQESNESFAPAAPYQHMGLAYYLNDQGVPFDGYVPVGGNEFSEFSVSGNKHGVFVTVYLSQRYDDAAHALDTLSDTTFVNVPALTDMATSEGGGLADGNTVGVRFAKVHGYLEDGTETGYLQATYADIRANGYYMIAIIQLNEQGFDADTPALIAEINDVFGLNLPTDSETLIVFLKQ